MKKYLFALLSLAPFLTGCATPYGLQPGQDAAQIRERMGDPAQRWQRDDGGEQWAYPTAPAGTATWMLQLGPDGRLERLENVLTMAHFARIQSGMKPEQVLRELGPRVASWDVDFPARRERVWSWRYCDDWAEPARFHVLFDMDTGVVRSTQSLTESQILFGYKRQYCGR